MATNPNEHQPYLVVKQAKIPSQYGGYVTQIDMIGIKDRLEYHTYVDAANFNYKHWRHIIEHSDTTMILNELTTKDFSKGLISADSRPIIEHQTRRPEEILGPIREFWAEEDRRDGGTTFNDLFK
jgi:hypothetical protein